MVKRSWTEVRLETLVSNYRIYRSLVPKEQRVMAVVKADAYGHGDTATALALQKEGVTDFAVSNITEAVGLRKVGIRGQILILGYTPPENAKDLVTYKITQALLSESYAEKMADKGITAQFAIDTGMNRIGLDADDPAACERIIRAYRDRFTLTGMFTHFCVADTPAEDAFTDAQKAKFFAVADRVKDLEFPCVHCMNSAGGLWHNAAGEGDLVRLGIILYGLKPDCENTLPEGIRPALSWKSVVSLLKTVHPGETIGYGRTYRAEADRVIATVPTGYADGYNRLISNNGYVMIKGQRAPVVGRVCMDQMTVDVTGIPGVAEGDEVVLLGEGLDADEMASWVGSIGYEVLCDIGKRVERRYVN